MPAYHHNALMNGLLALCCALAFVCPKAGANSLWLRGHRLVVLPPLPHAVRDRPADPTATIYEIALFSKAPSWWQPQVGQLATPFDPQALGELRALENQKFQRFADLKYLDPTADAELIASVRQFEALENHDDVLVVYHWDMLGDSRPRTPTNFPPRRLVAMMGAKRSELLLENRLGTVLEEAKPVPVADTLRYPLHWRWGRFHQRSTIVPGHNFARDILAGVSELVPPEAIRWYSGGKPLQLSSTYVDEKEGRPWLAYALGVLYWHGALTEGTVIPRKKVRTIGGVEIEGPAIIAPASVVLETLDLSHRRLMQFYQFSPLPIAGRTLFKDPFSESHTTSVETISLPKLETELSERWVRMIERFPSGCLEPQSVLPLNLVTIRGFEPDWARKVPPLFIFQPAGQDMVLWKGSCRYSLSNIGNNPTLITEAHSNAVATTSEDTADLAQQLQLGRSLCDFNSTTGAPTLMGPVIDEHLRRLNNRPQ